MNGHDKLLSAQQAQMHTNQDWWPNQGQLSTYTPPETDPVKLAKNRLAVLQTSLAMVESWKKEAAKLQRMIDAAEMPDNA